MADTESTFQFRTHWNYVSAFAYLAVPDWTVSENELRQTLYTQVDEIQGGTPRRSSNEPLDPQISRNLRAALSTEILLRRQLELCESSPELSQSVSTWAAIQGYYACYHAFQSLIVSSGQARPNSHSVTHRQFASLWLTNRNRITPWSLGYKADEAINYERPISRVSNISLFDPTHALTFADMSLRTTWKNAVEEALRDDRLRRQKDRERLRKSDQSKKLTATANSRHKHEAKSTRLTSAQRSSISDGIGPATLLHYLYRLRISANYVEADTFLDGAESDFDAIRFVRALTILSSATIRVHERRIAHQIGQTAISQILTP